MTTKSTKTTKTKAKQTKTTAKKAGAKATRAKKEATKKVDPVAVVEEEDVTMPSVLTYQLKTMNDANTEAKSYDYNDNWTDEQKMEALKNCWVNSSYPELGLDDLQIRENYIFFRNEVWLGHFHIGNIWKPIIELGSPDGTGPKYYNFRWAQLVEDYVDPKTSSTGHGTSGSGTDDKEESTKPTLMMVFVREGIEAFSNMLKAYEAQLHRKDDESDEETDAVDREIEIWDFFFPIDRIKASKKIVDKKATQGPSDRCIFQGETLAKWEGGEWVLKLTTPEDIAHLKAVDDDDDADLDDESDDD